VESLILILQTMVWINSGHHAAVNFSQYTYSSYGPNAPVNIMQPHPDGSVELTEKDFMNCIPGYQIAALVISVTNTLSTFASADEEEYLGAPRQKLFTEVQALAALDAFNVDLKRVEQLLIERDKKRAITYPFLFPSAIPGSIAI